MKKTYELIPDDGRKSFYGKAIVVIDSEDNSETLYSYNTPIIRSDSNGKLTRLYGGYSVTTGRHIRSFCGLNKKQFMEMEIEK